MMYDLIVFLPLLGALVAGLFGRWTGHRNAEFVTTTLLSISCALAWVGFFQVGLGHGEEHKASWSRSPTGSRSASCRSTGRSASTR